LKSGEFGPYFFFEKSKFVQVEIMSKFGEILASKKKQTLLARIPSIN
jgi:hypothetical protein